MRLGGIVSLISLYLVEIKTSTSHLSRGCLRKFRL